MKKMLCLAIIIFATAVGINAQSFKTGYFLDNYLFSYEINPAARPADTRGFVGIGIDNICVGANGNVGLDSFLFPVTVDGKKALVTGLNENVDADTFLGGLKDNNRICTDVSLNLLGFGFSGERYFCTVELNVRANVMASVPKDVFTILKTAGDRDGTYSINGVELGTTDYLELVTGYSYRISDRVSVGGRVKFLAGAADGYMCFDSINATSGTDLEYNTSGSLDLYALGQTMTPDENGNFNPDFDVDPRNLRPGGYGFAFDLGVEASFMEENRLELSASILDLGGIFWRRGCHAISDCSGRIGAETEGQDSFPGLFRVETSDASDFIGIGTKANLGVKYRFSDMFSAGVLASSGIGRYSVTEARIGASFSPWSCLSLAASGGVNNYGTSIGCGLSFRVPGISLFVGTDSVITSFTPEFIPIRKLNTRVNAGLAIAF